VPNSWKRLTEAPPLDLRPDADGAEPHHRRLLYWLPVLLVFTAFVTLLIVPYLVGRRTTRLRAEVLANANPAHELVDQISVDLASEASSIRAYVLSQDDSFLAGYRQARDRETLAVYRLQPYVERMGGPALHTYPELQVALGQWHRAQQQLIDRHVTREEYIARLADTQRLYDEASESTQRLSGQIGRYIKGRRDRIIQSDNLDTIVTMALAFLGIMATVGVAWLAIGLSRLAMQLNRRAREEMAFRQVASALTGAVEVDEVLHEVTLNAALVTRADGAYVEKIVGETVEIVSSSGRGAPPRGTKARYPGSLTQDVIDSGRPVILTDMQSYGAEMAPYLKDSCENCELLIVPLLADRQALGALVLLNSSTSGRHFGKGDAQRAKALGDLVSLALRRVVMIHREREALEAAQLALKTRNEFLGIVSHDLRNPLTAILLSASMLEQHLTGDLKEQAETIRSAAERMQRLIADLLDAARTEGGRLSLHLQSIDTPAMLRSVVDAHRSSGRAEKAETRARRRGVVAEDLRRSRPADAALRKPGRQRHQVHPSRRHRDHRRPRCRQCRGALRDRQRAGHPRTRAEPGLRALLAGQENRPPRRRPRPDHRQRHRRIARRHHRGGESAGRGGGVSVHDSEGVILIPLEFACHPEPAQRGEGPRG
jgi:GAF domain-containing protein/CHASE3 domain sensor protein